MVRVCVVPGCSKCSDREKNLTFHSLLLKNSVLLRTWVHKIGCKNLPLNNNSRICSEHFANSNGRKLHPNEYPTKKLPFMTTPTPKRKPPVLRFDKENIFSEPSPSTYTISRSAEGVATCMLDVGTQTIEYEALSDLKAQVCILQSKLSCAQFRLSNFTTDRDIRFYTGFPNYRSLMAFYKFLGPAVNCLSYWGSEISGDVKLTQGRNRSLPQTEEFFLVLVQLPVGLLEKDLTDRYGISVSTVSRICITCINFIYIRLKDIPLWPTHGLVQAHMPKVF